jgi:hypothetical protein
MEETFKNIKKIRAHIKDMFLSLTAKKEIVNSCYLQYIDKNKKNKMFGLDSFHFQSKLIELEYKHLHDEYLFMDNRIYCDYYKLYGIVSAFCKHNFKTDYKFIVYPVYKDLEPYRVYDFDTINNIHYNIIDLFNHIQIIIKNREDEINKDRTNMKTGLNLDNYIYNLEYKNNILISNVKLYENYLNSYHIYHMKFLRKLNDKIFLYWNQLSNNIKINNEPITSELNNTTQLKSVDDILKNETENSLCNENINNTINSFEDFSEELENILIEKDFQVINKQLYKTQNIEKEEFEQLEDIPEKETYQDNLNEEQQVELMEELVEEFVKVPITEEPRQRYEENISKINSQESDKTTKESFMVSSEFNETIETTGINLYLNEPVLVEEINESVHITPDFMNDNIDKEQQRDSALERNYMIPEILEDNLLNSEFIGIKESVVNENKKKRKKKRN